MTQLTITVDRRPGCSLVSLAGDLDLRTRPSVVDALDRLVLGEEVPRIVIDASELGFCDSYGLWTLYHAQRQAEARGGCLRLFGVHGMLARLLTITQMVDQFPPYADLAQACR
ncbi:hypothetical protein GCM10010412_095260 [Nonomuraea recticatena]|uniref:Anti-sigma factor antagonist n=1 Tax=Nonomuraea recticatena TaxID=46178 RepID=A0ABN3TB67_9ACTN